MFGVNRNRTMKPQLSGGCACGAVRFTCASTPVAMLNCHCSDCQRSSGAPFASGVVVLSSDLSVSGKPAEYSVIGSSGQQTARTFCATCGTPLFTRGESNPAFTSIRFPALDKHIDFRPMLDIWTSRAQPWVCLDPSIPKFQQSPQPPGDA
jgi:hypothetical protein